MRVIIISDARKCVPRPRLSTPAKGELGDMCHEEQAAECSIKRIMQRYAGNLQEMLAWRSKPLDFCDATIVSHDLQEAINLVNNSKAELERLANEYGITPDQLKECIEKGIMPIKENKDEKTSDQPKEVEKDLPKDGE